jgi:hypothetical protein
VTVQVHRALDRFGPVGLDELNAQAAMLRRKDRKYLLAASDLAELLSGMPEGTRRLETDPGRWSEYESTYLDTGGLDLYLMAARCRPNRCKVRLRRYLDSGLDMIEIKVKDHRNQTVKHRRSTAFDPGVTLASMRAFAAGVEQSAPFAANLRPILANRYRRATLLLPSGSARATIDVDYRAGDIYGQYTGLGNLVVVETKTDGRPSSLDRLLWWAGHRPVKFSKYCTAMAALNSELPANRWHRVLPHHTSEFLVPAQNLGRLRDGHSNRSAVRDEEREVAVAVQDLGLFETGPATVGAGPRAY